MEVVQRENIKVPNSVIVSGLTDTEADEELIDFLNKYGRVARVVRVDSPTSPYHKDAIVEYESGSALNALKPALPYSYESPSRATYRIRALSSEYVPIVTGSATQCFLSELQSIAKLSGRSFEEILKEQLSECSKSVETEFTSEPASEPAVAVLQSPPAQLPAPEPQVSYQTHSEITRQGETSLSSTPSHTKGDETPKGATNYVNPPEVQRMVVEHIVRSEAPVSQMNVSFRLRSFSGKTPCPSHEADFDTWRNSVELLLQDTALSDLQRSRKILDSLVSPAVEVVKHLGPRALPTAYLELLDSAFGTVEDGDELFAKFLNTLQDAGEKPSHYLYRLQTVLAKALKRGGISASETDKHLLRQFCRGCWDDVLIADLQLERRRNDPPPFSELLLQLRVEEDRHSAKENRMRKHLGSSKQKVSAHLLTASPLTDDAPVDSDLTDMRKQVTELQSQLTRLKASKSEPKQPSQDSVVAELKRQVTELQSQLTSLKTPKPPQTKTNVTKFNTKQSTRSKESPSTAEQRPSSRPKPWYCFQCGEDGHIATSCPNDPNPTLVAAKRRQLKEKQSLWDNQNSSVVTQPLN